MKKILAVVLCLAMISAVFAGCTSKQEETVSPSVEVSQSEAVSAETVEPT